MTRRFDLASLRIDPQRPVSLSYLGRTYTGYEGDSVATVLYGGGVRIFGRSHKYHRPRGLYSLDGECANCLMDIDSVPNTGAETTPAVNGMRVAPQNVRGSPQRDLLAFLDRLDRFMPAGFYYNHLHKPARLWPAFARLIRKGAGLGRLDPGHEPGLRCDEIFPAADVCVLGGGPAGLSASLAAADAGARVVLLESRPWLGGNHAYRGSLHSRVAPQIEKTLAHPRIRVFTSTDVLGTYQDNLVAACQNGGSEDPFDRRYLEVRAASLAVCTGTRERPLLFENNDRPGVMQVSCARRLLRHYGLLPGQRAVFSVGHDEGLETAVDCFDLGLEVAGVADYRLEGQSPELVAALKERAIPYFKGWCAHRVKGGRLVTAVQLAPLGKSRSETLSCDTLVASAGLTPVTGPLTMLPGVKQELDDKTGFYLPVNLPASVHSGGRLLGYEAAESIETSGALAGLRAAADAGFAAAEDAAGLQRRLGSLPGPVPGGKLVCPPVKGRKAFICFDEDATLKNVRQAIDRGFDVPELIKRYAAVGTGPGQSGLPGHNLPLLVSEATARLHEPYPPTTRRPPLKPVLMSGLAGSNREMSKRTPVHSAQKRLGGVMEQAGVWRRARYFNADRDPSSEVRAVRNQAGLIDVSTLGKFRVFGPDALKALQRIYVGDMSRVGQGKVTYSAMVNEDGCLIDDGVLVKRGPDDYYLTTSTGRAGQTVEWFRYHTRFEDWDYGLVNLTDAFGALNLAGPRARAILQRLTDQDISNQAFPFLGYRELTLLGRIPARAMRLGFVGELSFELHLPASWLQPVWDRLLEAGRDEGLTVFGLEAQSILRLEKGHVIIGSESEQRTTLHDLGLGFLWSKSKDAPSTVGAPALRRTEHQPGRLKLTGFTGEPGQRPPRDGCLIVDDQPRGYVCTARFSQTLGRPIGMALVEDGLLAASNELQVLEDGDSQERMSVQVTRMPFYDPEGKRLRM